MEQDHTKAPPASSQDVAFRRYTLLTGMIQYEGTVMWTRSQLYLVAHAALLGFVSTKLPYGDLGSILWTQFVTVFIFAVSGLCLAHFWRLSLAASEHYLEHWLDDARAIEPESFDDIQIFRFPGPTHGGRRAAHLTSKLFISLWILVCLFLVACAVLKVMHLSLL